MLEYFARMKRINPPGWRLMPGAVIGAVTTRLKAAFASSLTGFLPGTGHVEAG